MEKGAFFFFYFLLFFFDGTKRNLFHRHFENTCGTDTKTPGIYGGFQVPAVKYFHIHLSERPESSLLVLGMRPLIGIPLRLSWRSPGKKRRRGGKSSTFLTAYANSGEKIELRYCTGPYLAAHFFHLNLFIPKRLPITSTLYFSKLKPLK